MASTKPADDFGVELVWRAPALEFGEGFFRVAGLLVGALRGDGCRRRPADGDDARAEGNLIGRGDGPE